MALKRFFSFVLANLHPILWAATVILAAYIAYYWPAKEHLVGALLLLLLVSAITSFVVTFTGPVTEARLEAMFRFCYAVGLLIVLVSIVFFFFPRQDRNYEWPQFTGPVGIVLGCTRAPEFEHGDKWITQEIACEKNSTQWLLNFGGKVTRCPEDSSDGEKCEGTAVTGGLVVPLYFLIVSLIGALISLTRRVPEYHRRVGPNCISPISREEAREYMIFQLMQVISAPLIASAAYYLIDPASRAASVAVAFISGFSSETILLWIRNIVTKLQPEKGETSQVVVTPAQLDFGEQPRGTASPAKTLLLTNRGQTPLTVSALDTSPEFAWAHTAPAAGRSATDLPFTVAATSAHQINVTFTPADIGPRDSDLSIADNATGGPRVVRLTGTGTAGEAAPHAGGQSADGAGSEADGQSADGAGPASSIQLSRRQVDFGSLSAGTTHRAEPLRLINTGEAAVNVDIGVEGDFECTPKGPLTIEREQLLTITFRPSVPGTRAGRLTLKEGGKVVEVALRGST